jgi:hypothetical protein
VTINPTAATAVGSHHRRPANRVLKAPAKNMTLTPFGSCLFRRSPVENRKAGEGLEQGGEILRPAAM